MCVFVHVVRAYMVYLKTDLVLAPHTHTHTHTYKHTYKHTYIHTYIHTHTHAHARDGRSQRGSSRHTSQSMCVACVSAIHRYYLLIRNLNCTSCVMRPRRHTSLTCRDMFLSVMCVWSVFFCSRVFSLSPLTPIPRFRASCEQPVGSAIRGASYIAARGQCRVHIVKTCGTSTTK